MERIVKLDEATEGHCLCQSCVIWEAKVSLLFRVLIGLIEVEVHIVVWECGINLLDAFDDRVFIEHALAT